LGVPRAFHVDRHVRLDHVDVGDGVRCRIGVARLVPSVRVEGQRAAGHHVGGKHQRRSNARVHRLAELDRDREARTVVGIRNQRVADLDADHHRIQGIDAVRVYGLVICL